ncbi:carbon-nitrogen hydrolase family protein [Paludibacter jiangxiensis]|uniref:Predicted amidohydrolase n=1 Tax=Paludibacter jiangxiensis TaxID=681398 RepID=A0A171AQ39_9BACT|nr:carbon-nitrogen hydrolase family protein [Paludibacter jiangxiensis]GAT64099.1 predicted amidohydrolase [Paludibacter jiangxiensis]
MKICIVQTSAFKGDIEKNISKHLQFLDLAIANQCDLVVFPELSLTGYEPTLAKELATTSNDDRLSCFQKISDQQNIIICIGLPTQMDATLFISMIIFQPDKEPITYSKQHRYPSEVDYFSPGATPVYLHIDETVVAPAICYELSVSQHAENAYRNQASVYLASVLNSVSGVDADLQKLSDIARKYHMTTVMANYVGESGGYECAGKSSVWHADGNLAGQLDGTSEGILIYDTTTKSVFQKLI